MLLFMADQSISTGLHKCEHTVLEDPTKHDNIYHNINGAFKIFKVWTIRNKKELRISAIFPIRLKRSHM